MPIDAAPGPNRYTRSVAPGRITTLHRLVHDWRIKALVQRVISGLPRSVEMNYLFQRRVSKRLPLSQEAIDASIPSGRLHIDAFEARVGVALADARFFEFGAGWDMANPIALFALGVRHQVVIDIRALARAELVVDVIRRLPRSAIHPSGVATLDQLGASRVGSPGVKEILRHLGIEYRAPCDARRSGLAAGSIDCVTSTAVLEHIPRQDIGPILAECHRVLAANGILTCEIDYHDHYCSSDDSITPYNFLRYSRRSWRIFNSSIHFQNRLQHSEYVELFERAGFKVLEEKKSAVGPTELRQLATVDIDADFRRFDPSELALTQAFFVLGKS